MPALELGPHFERPPFPQLEESQQLDPPDTDKVVRNFRKIYDWKAYTPDGLAIMEAYWDIFIEHVFIPLLPAEMQTDRARHRGINLGTFNGTYQKAWVRNGYPMYGIEIADVIDELHEYGLEGHRASFFDLSSIDEGEFDFGVLDRAICTPGFYETYDRSHEDEPVTRQETVPALFESIFRIIRPGGTLIGILYGWYSGAIVREIARYGSLKIWPTYLGLLGFRLTTGLQPTPIPPITEVPITESPLFRRFYPTYDGVAGLYLPTNEIIVRGAEGSEVSFGPRSPHWPLLSK